MNLNICLHTYVLCQKCFVDIIDLYEIHFFEEFVHSIDNI